MKILFISFFDGQLRTGGEMCSDRNFKSLKSLYGDENVILFSIKRTAIKTGESKIKWNLKNIFIDIFERGFGGLSSSDKEQIYEKINEQNINTVFIDTSLLGILSKKIKSWFPKVNVITFFHNVEYYFFSQHIRQEKTYMLYYRILLAHYSEKLACKYSDKIIALNHRDGNEINILYKRIPDTIIPISLEDKYKIISDSPTSKIKTGLFVGSYFFANVQGIVWFINNVLPRVEMKLIIVGQGMEKLNELLSMEVIKNVTIHSFVPNLQHYYEEADFSILPIFMGGGMKVKTAEALMFGKYLIGTKEAFIGYDINDDLGACCNTEEEMIDAINKFNAPKKYNCKSKEHFTKYYSFEATRNKFKQLIDCL